MADVDNFGAESSRLLRRWRDSDPHALASIADDPDVARYLTGRFPSPYTIADAESWIELDAREAVPTSAAIYLDGALAGGVGFTPHRDIYQGTAEIGYWLGKAFWGRGIAAEALALMTRYAFDTFELRRLHAHVMAANRRSARVLEKTGYVLEATLRARCIDREGAIHDALLYARFPDRG